MYFRLEHTREIATQTETFQRSIESQTYEKKDDITFLRNHIKVLQEKIMRFEDLQKENDLLRRNIEELLKKQKENESDQVLLSKTKELFTKGQLKRLTSPLKTVHWENDDIAEAISIHAAGPKLYRLLKSKGFPLPGESTIRRWTSNVNIKPGDIDVSFDLLKNMSLEPLERVCVIIADEMKVRECHEYNKATDTLIAPSSQVQVAFSFFITLFILNIILYFLQVVVVQGLFANWHQPIYFDFNQDLSKELLFHLIERLHAINFEVRAVNFDLGPKNIKLLESLTPSFNNPCDNEKIYMFADVPHLIKLIRNHLIDKGILMKNGHVLTKEPLVKLLGLTKNDSFKITYKITEENLCAKGFQKQKVKTAVQLLSRTNSAALKRAVSLNLVDKEDVEAFILLSDFLELVSIYYIYLKSFHYLI